MSQAFASVKHADHKVMQVKDVPTKKAAKKILDGIACIAPSVAFFTPAKRSSKQTLS
ncbi:MAG: hypothetical protein WBK51_14400 [Polaromonas sp.]